MEKNIFKEALKYSSIKELIDNTVYERGWGKIKNFLTGGYMLLLSSHVSIREAEMWMDMIKKEDDILKVMIRFIYFYNKDLPFIIKGFEISKENVVALLKKEDNPSNFDKTEYEIYEMIVNNEILQYIEIYEEVTNKVSPLEIVYEDRIISESISGIKKNRMKTIFSGVMDSEKKTTDYIDKNSEFCNPVLVMSGSFIMGENSGNVFVHERPAHEVKINYDFFIDAYQVTFDRYDEICEEVWVDKPADNGWGRGLRPVININRYQAMEFCNWLSIKAGLMKAYDKNYRFLDKNGVVTTDISKVEGYRLGTEAEWEFAASGGRLSMNYTYSGSDVLDEVGWYINNSGEMTHEVGLKKPNELGIYDMAGNTAEFTADFFNLYTSTTQTNPVNCVKQDKIIIRGSMYDDSALYSRITVRNSVMHDYKSNGIGFRLFRTAI